MINAVIVDDEKKAIHNLTILLEEFCRDVKVLGTARSVDEAIPLVEKSKPDVIFLDIEMPKRTGFDLLDNISDTIQVIFVTAYSAYAVKAFEVSAVDYLLKPIKIKRLKEAIEKVAIYKNITQSQSKFNTLKNNLLSDSLTQLQIKYKDHFKVIDIENILAIEAESTYSTIYFLEGKELIKSMYSRPLNYFEELFQGNNLFFRSHRSWLINTKHIVNFFRTQSFVELVNGLKTPISRRKMKSFQELVLNK